MSREFKFRVYVKELRKFVYFELGEFLHPERYLNQDGIDVQQFTGLYDKNNKPIYEGDYIKEHHFEDWGDKIGHDYFGIVVYKAHSDDLSFAGYKTIPINNQNTNFIGNAIQSDCEVIGNQFELPCSKPGSFDENGECWICDGWATDCPFIKTRKLNTHDKPSN